MKYVIIVLLVILLIQYLIYSTKDRKYIKKLNCLIFAENNPAEALNLIEEKISNSSLVQSENYIIGKFYVLVWLGKWNEAERILKWIFQKKRLRRVYRVHFYKILLGFFTQDYSLVKDSYEKFMDDRELDKKGISKIESDILECLYSFHIEKNYTKCIEIFNGIQKRHKIPVLYLAVLYYYVGQAKLELGEIEESISYFSKSMIFGQHTFFKEKARNMLMKIKDEASEQNRKEIIDAIECSINEAHVQLEEQVKETV